MSRKKCGKKVFFKESEIGPERRLPGFSNLVRPKNEAKRHYFGSTAMIRLGRDPSIRISLSFFGNFAVPVQLKKPPLKKRLIADCRAGIIST